MNYEFENENDSDNKYNDDDSFLDPATEASFVMECEDRILGVINNNPHLFDPELKADITNVLTDLGRALFMAGALYSVGTLKCDLMEIVANDKTSTNTTSTE